MMVGVKAKIESNLAFLSAQCLVSELLDGSTLLADHEAMATFCITQVTLYKSTAG
jgi:hypothetical protein